MDVSSIAKLATAITDTGTRQEVDVAILKRAQQIESSTATQLIDGLKAVAQPQNLPAHLGKNINTTA